MAAMSVMLNFPENDIKGAGPKRLAQVEHRCFRVVEVLGGAIVDLDWRSTPTHPVGIPFCNDAGFSQIFDPYDLLAPMARCTTDNSPPTRPDVHKGIRGLQRQAS
jgi:hypothetical protein